MGLADTRLASVAEPRRILAFAAAEAIEHGLQDLLGILARQFAVGDAVLDNLAQMGAGFHLRGRQVVELGVAIVGDYDAQVGIEHGKALHHVVECRIQLQVLRLDFLLMLLQQQMLPLQLGAELLPLRDVLVGDDATAVCRLPGIRDDATSASS